MLKITLCNKKVTKIFGSLQLFCYLCTVIKTKSSMKYNELTRRLTKAGCFVVRNGADHDIWFSPITGKQRPVPRHGSQEVSKGLLRKLEKDLLGL